jgi:hypothetical protein
MNEAQVLSFPKGNPALEYFIAVDYYVAPPLGESAHALGLHQWTVRLRAANAEAAGHLGVAEFFDAQKALGAFQGLTVVRVRTVLTGNMRASLPKEPSR